MASIEFGVCVGIADICTSPDAYTEEMIATHQHTIDRSIIRYYLQCPNVANKNDDIEQTPLPLTHRVQFNSSDGQQIIGNLATNRSHININTNMNVNVDTLQHEEHHHEQSSSLYHQMASLINAPNMSGSENSSDNGNDSSIAASFMLVIYHFHAIPCVWPLIDKNDC
jgi:hypothetical protein